MDLACQPIFGESYCKHVSTCIHRSSSTALTDALYNEKPPPSSTSVDTVEIAVRRGLQVTREHGAKRVAHEPDACTLEQLFILVPRADCEG